MIKPYKDCSNGYDYPCVKCGKDSEIMLDKDCLCMVCYLEIIKECEKYIKKDKKKQ